MLAQSDKSLIIHETNTEIYIQEDDTLKQEWITEENNYIKC